MLGYHIVVGTVHRRSMNRTGTGVGGHVLTGNHGHKFRPATDGRHKGMLHHKGRVFLTAELTKRRPLGRSHHLIGVGGNAVTLHGAGNQIAGQQQNFIGFLQPHQRVFQRRVYRHRFVGRQGPGRGGPDHNAHRFAGQCRIGGKFFQQRFRGGKGELHIDGDGFFILIFHFRFSKRRAAIGTPVHWFKAFVQMSVGNDFAQRADNVGFKIEVHGQVGIVPVTQHH